VLVLGMRTATSPLQAAEDPGIALPPVPRDLVLAANDAAMPIRHVAADATDGGASDDGDAAATALSLGPKTIRASPGTTTIVEVAIDHLNRLVTPIASPQVRTVSPATTQVDGSAVYVAAASEDPVSLFITEAFLPYLSLGEHPLVVAITSHMGSIADITAPRDYAYRSSKAALNVAMLGLARELEPTGIGVLLLHPGWARTPHGRIVGTAESRGKRPRNAVARGSLPAEHERRALSLRRGAPTLVTPNVRPATLTLLRPYPDRRPSMHRVAATIFSALTASLLFSCGQKEPSIDVDPQVGRACFDAHTASLPPGTQYEGIERAVEGRITIRVMTGVELTTAECALNPDRTLQSAQQ